MLNIERSTATVSNDESKQAAFELKGRRSTCASASCKRTKFLQTSWRKADADVASDKPAAAAARPHDRQQQWSPYGKLT